MTLDDIRNICTKQVGTIEYVTVSPQYFKEIQDDCGYVTGTPMRSIHFLYQDNNRKHRETLINYGKLWPTNRILIHMASGHDWWIPWETDSIPDTEETPTCNHKYVNVGFNSLLMVCKHCDKEQT